MREIVVAVDSQDTIKLGYLGENNFQVVRFDIGDWLRDHKNGQAVLLFKVNGMDAPYPCKVEIQGKYANWILTKADLQYGRNGRCQLFYYADGEVVAQSSIFYTDVANSLGEQTTTEPPESFTNWVHDVLASGVLAEKAAKLAKQIHKQMNDTLQSTQQTFDAALRQGLGSIEAVKEQAAQTADAANKTVLDALTEGLHQIDTAQTQAVTAVTEEGERQAERLDALVPDEYYTKEESDARYAQSENVVSQLCPSFEVSGSVITCNPVEDSKLNVLAQIEPVQEGEGEPSPGNIRPIRGWDTVRLTHNEKEISIPLGQTVYSGTLDVTTGLLTINRVLYQIPISNLIEQIRKDWGISSALYKKGIGFILYLYRLEFREALHTLSISDIIFDVFKTENAYTSGGEYPVAFLASPTIYNQQYISFRIPYSMLGVTYESELNDIKLAVSAFFSDRAIDTVSVFYPVQNVIAIQLTPQEIFALSGTNTIYADSGNVTVSGYSDPITIMNALADRIAALEQNAIGG